MTKKHGIAPLIVLIIGFAVGFLFGRGLEWEFNEEDDMGWDL